MLGWLFKKKININSEEVKNVKHGHLLDVRAKGEWNTGHLPRATHAPLSSLLSNPQRYIKHKDEVYYIYCLSGGRAGQATRSLKAKGYNVINIGGVMRYNQKLVK